MSEPAFTDDRLIEPERKAEDADVALRPKRLDDFVGQPQARDNLRVFVEAAKSRGEALDHVLFHGPPGLGKTTLAQIVANELGVNFKSTSGPVLSKPGDLAALLTNLEANDVLFIDEIHRLTPAVEEVLYPAMEDFALDLLIGEGPAARSVKIDLPRFTLVGATTRSGLLAKPLLDRFGIPVRLEFYSHTDLQSIVARGAGKLGAAMSCGRRHGESPSAAVARRGLRAGSCAVCAMWRLSRAPISLTPKLLTRRSNALRLTRSALIRWTGGIFVSLRSILAAAPSALKPSPHHLRSRATPLKTSWSRSYCNRGSSSARRAGVSCRRAPGPIWDSVRQKPPATISFPKIGQRHALQTSC